MAAGPVQGEGFAVDARIIAADANSRQSVPGNGPVEWNGSSGRHSRAVREYLDALDGATEVETTPKRISLTDPQSRWIAMKGNPAFFAYSTNYLDGHCPRHHPGCRGHTGLSNGRGGVHPGDDRTRRGALSSLAPAPDGGHCLWRGTHARLAGRRKRHRAACACLGQIRSVREDGTFSQSEFIRDAQANEYRCPAGHALRSDWRPFRNPRSRITQENTIIYRSSQRTCKTCPKKTQCCPNTPMRKIARSIHENARDVARRISTTPEYQRSRCERKKVEMLFAHLKRILRLDRLRLRGLSGASDELTLAATAQNLRRLARFITQPLPGRGIGVPI